MRPTFKHHHDEKFFRKPFRDKLSEPNHAEERKETKARRKARKTHPRNQ